jgi:hypothetical protein
MRARRAILPLSVLLAGLPSVAGAKYAFQASVALSGGWTNNASGASANTPGTPTDSDFFFLISPSVVFTSALPRAVQRISYNFSTQLYASHPELASLANRLDWGGFFAPSASTELLLGVYGSQSQINTVNVTTVDSATTPAQVTRPGSFNYFGAGANETLLWNWSKTGRLIQGAGFGAFIPTSSGLGTTYTGSGSLGTDYSFRRDAIGGDVKLDYVYFDAQRGPVTNPDGTVNPDGIVVPVQQQILGNALARWRHDFGNFWNTELDFGVVVVMRASDGGGQIWQPAGAAAVRYLHPKISGELAYSHGAAPSALVQTTFMNDTVSLRGGAPLGAKSKLAFGAGATYTHGQALDSNNGTVGSAINLFLVDASLNWAPVDGLTLFTRYQYQNQLGDETLNPPIASFSRHLVMLGLTYIYPPVGAAVVPARLSQRVDKSDEVGIPDLHSQQPR